MRVLQQILERGFVWFVVSYLKIDFRALNQTCSIPMRQDFDEHDGYGHLCPCFSNHAGLGRCPRSIDHGDRSCGPRRLPPRLADRCGLRRLLAGFDRPLYRLCLRFADHDGRGHRNAIKNKKTPRLQFLGNSPLLAKTTGLRRNHRGTEHHPKQDGQYKPFHYPSFFPKPSSLSIIYYNKP